MYLDPGFGGMLLQVLIALAAVSGAVLFSLRKKLRGLFPGKKAGSNRSKPINITDDTEEGVIDTINENEHH